MKYVLFVAATLICGVAGITQANGFGVAVDKIVGDYTVNIDYDAVMGIYPDEPVQFAFQLFDKERVNMVPFDDVWVTVLPVGAASYAPPVFEGGIVGSKTSVIPAGMTLAFPYGGSYMLRVRYDQGDSSIAEAEFLLTVQGDAQKAVYVSKKKLSTYLLIGIIGTLMVEFGIQLLFKNKRKTV